MGSSVLDLIDRDTRIYIHVKPLSLDKQHKLLFIERNIRRPDYVVILTIRLHSSTSIVPLYKAIYDERQLTSETYDNAQTVILASG